MFCYLRAQAAGRVIWNISDSKKLFSDGYYGKPIGIPKPKFDEIDVPLILDLIEGYYLVLKSKIQIFRNKKRITTNNMLKICQEYHHNFNKKFQVYNSNEYISSTDVVLAGRLAASVKKQFVLAIPRINKKVDYIALDWWKA